MIIEKIHLENWGIFREPAEFDFEEGINIVYGPNESGKSTLVDSIHTLLFTKHNSKGGKITSLQPWGSVGIYPSGYLTFKHKNQKYRLTKAFFSSRSIIEQLIDGTWIRIAEGDAADLKVIELLGGRLPTRGDTKPDMWGIGQSLWMRQGQISLADNINEETLTLIKNMIGVSVETETGKRLFNVIRKKYLEIFTEKKRQYKKGSEICRLQEKIADIQARIDKVKQLKIQKEILIDEIEKSETLLAEEKILLKNKKDILTRLEKAFSEAIEHRRQREELERDVKQLNMEYRRVKKVLDAFNNTLAEIKESEEMSSRIICQEQQTEILLKEYEQKEEALYKEIEKIKDKIEKTGKYLEAIRIAEKVVTYSEKYATLAEEVQRIREKKEKLKTLYHDYENLSAPSKAELKNLETLDNEIRALQAKLDISGLDIVIKALTDIKGVAASDINTEKICLSKNEIQKLHANSTVNISIDNIVSVSIDSGSEDVKKLSEQLEEKKIEYKKLTSVYEKETISGLHELSASKEALKQELKKFESELKKSLNLKPKENIFKALEGLIDSKIRKIAEIEETSRQLKVKLPTHKDITKYIEDYTDTETAKKHMSKEIDILLTRENEDKKALKNLEKNLHSCLKSKNKLKEELNQMDKEIHGISERIKEKKKNLDTIKTEYHSIENIKEELINTAADMERKEMVLKKFNDEIEEKEIKPQKMLDKCRKEIDKLSNHIGNIENNIFEKKGSLNRLIKEISDTTEEEEKLESLTEREKTLRLEAESIALIYDLMNFYKNRTVEALTQPVKKIINRDMETIFGTRYSGIKIDENILPKGVNVSAFGTDAGINTLSFGAKEQIWFLFRLALAELLSTNEKQLVILDDPLRHTDTTRLPRALDVLQSKSDKMQIIVVTCEISKYAKLHDANLIPVISYAGIYRQQIYQNHAVGDKEMKE